MNWNNLDYLELNVIDRKWIGTWQTSTSLRANGPNSQRSVQSNFSTVAILPVSDDVPLTQFGHELYQSLSWIGKHAPLN